MCTDRGARAEKKGLRHMMPGWPGAGTERDLTGHFHTVTHTYTHAHTNTPIYTHTVTPLTHDS